MAVGASRPGDNAALEPLRADGSLVFPHVNSEPLPPNAPDAPFVGLWGGRRHPCAAARAGVGEDTMEPCARRPRGCRLRLRCEEAPGSHTTAAAVAQGLRAKTGSARGGGSRTPGQAPVRRRGQPTSISSPEGPRSCSGFNTPARPAPRGGRDIDIVLSRADSSEGHGAVALCLRSIIIYNAYVCRASRVARVRCRSRHPLRPRALWGARAAMPSRRGLCAGPRAAFSAIVLPRCGPT